MPRFVKVMGRPDLLVANPHALRSDPPRFAGQRRKLGPIEDPAGLIDFYEPVEEVLLWNSHLQTAITKGELHGLGRCDAKSASEAAKKLAQPTAPAAKSGKRGE